MGQVALLLISPPFWVREQSVLLLIGIIELSLVLCFSEWSFKDACIAGGG